jgi:hypothetical protein
MEFASLEDAFPQMEKKEKRNHKRKDGFQAYELPPTDPDRPAVKRMQEIPPINISSNSQENEFLDQSAIFSKRMTVNNSLPKPKSLIKIEQASDTPSFFGAEPFSNPSEDSLALYHGNVNKSNGYMLEADFTKSFENAGYSKSTGTSLPTPELRQRWKPMSVDRIDTSFTDTGSSRGLQFEGLSTDDIQAMRSKIDVLMARLDDLENRAEGASPQLEMLSFIMTGLFLMFALDLTVRKVSQ